VFDAKPKHANRVAARQRLHHRAVGRERRVDELAARLAVVVGHAHAARVVEQDAEEILLRDRARRIRTGGTAEEDDADRQRRSVMSTDAVEPARVARRLRYVSTVASAAAAASRAMKTGDDNARRIRPARTRMANT
jgi:predicted secreted protein